MLEELKAILNVLKQKSAWKPPWFLGSRKLGHDDNLLPEMATALRLQHTSALWLMICYFTRRTPKHAWNESGHWEEVSQTLTHLVSKLGKSLHFQMWMFHESINQTRFSLSRGVWSHLRQPRHYDFFWNIIRIYYTFEAKSAKSAPKASLSKRFNLHEHVWCNWIKFVVNPTYNLVLIILLEDTYNPVVSAHNILVEDSSVRFLWTNGDLSLTIAEPCATTKSI